MPASNTAPGSANSAANPVATMPTAFLRLAEVVRITGLPRSTLYRLIAANDFPAPCRLGRRAVGWRCDDIAQWGAARPVSRR